MMRSANLVDKNNVNHNKEDFFWKNLRDLPYFRALLRAVEARFYQDFKYKSPTLDLGCGDGHFAANTFHEKPQVGIDINYQLVNKAKSYHGHTHYIQCFGDKLPFESGYFSRIVSNSVLEHIEDLDAVIEETARVLKDGGDFLFCVPNQNFLSSLSIASGLDRVGLKGLANLYRTFFNRISRHYHCDSPDVWQDRLRRYGFTVEAWWHYFSPEAFHVLEWGHYFGLPSLIIHWMFNRWILIPEKWNLAFTERIVGRYYSKEARHPKGVYTFYVARK